MKMSRPWNVGETGCSHRSPLVSWNGPAGAAQRGDRPGQQAVVRPDQDAVAGLDGDAPAGGADPGVDDGHVHGGRQVRDGLGQHGGAAAHVAGLHQVGDVNDPGGRGDPGGDAMACGDEPVLQAVVRYEGEGIKGSHEG